MATVCMVPMPLLNYENGELAIERVQLGEIARSVGTPTYVYSRAAITHAYLEYRAAFDAVEQGQRHQVCYAVKANSNLGVLSILAGLGSGFDIVSVGELERVVAAGGDPACVVFSGVAKQTHEIERALQLGIQCFNVESESELGRIESIARAQGVQAPVSIRVNPDVDANTHPYISTGLKENKFGIDTALALELYRRAAASSALRVVGIDCHIGSQLTSMTPFTEAVERVLELVDRLSQEGITLEHIDVGGGLGVCYRDESPPQRSDYVANIARILAGREEAIIIEPGRSIVANAGALLCRVDTIKQNGDRHFAVVDAAMNDLIRPALYDAWMEVLPVRETRAATLHYDIVGPVCETGDFLAKDRALALAENDLLCINSAGAYGFVMSSNYNSRGRAAEVIVDGHEFKVVRERESIAELMRGESVF